MLSARPSSVSPGLLLLHSASQLCIHPEFGESIPFEGTRLILDQLCSMERRLRFSMLSNGNIRQSSSGKCWRPRTGQLGVAEGAEVVLSADCESEPARFDIAPSGSIRHVASKKCVSVGRTSGEAAKGDALVLRSACETAASAIQARVPDGVWGHSGGGCMYPESGDLVPPNDSRVVLWNDCRSNPRSFFRLTAEGSLQHIFSGKCLHPQGGGGSMTESGAELLFEDDCGHARIAFRVTPGGSIQHILSGKCVHPTARPNNPVVLSVEDGCNQEASRFFPAIFQDL